MKPLRPVIIPVGPSIAYVPLTQGLFSLIDREDAEFVGQFNWFASRRHGSDVFYATRNLALGNCKFKFLNLHRALLDPPEGFLCDHVSCETLDNRRINLRPATPAQNSRNARLPRNNTSGFKGVNVSRYRWRAQICVDGKNLELGSFTTATEAHVAYVAAAIKYHGEFARTA
jgi:hypothetical protein